MESNFLCEYVCIGEGGNFPLSPSPSPNKSKSSSLLATSCTYQVVAPVSLSYCGWI